MLQLNLILSAIGTIKPIKTPFKTRNKPRLALAAENFSLRSQPHVSGSHRGALFRDQARGFNGESTMEAGGMNHGFHGCGQQ